MSVLVTDTGFARDDWTGGFAPVGEVASQSPALDLLSDTDPASLEPHLSGVKMIRIQFPDFADGRGLTVARHLRLMGYCGRLRACGHILADQYAMIRRAGFDEVEIDDKLAARQHQEQWLARSDWRAHDYQALLRG